MNRPKSARIICHDMVLRDRNLDLEDYHYHILTDNPDHSQHISRLFTEAFEDELANNPAYSNMSIIEKFEKKLVDAGIISIACEVKDQIYEY